MDCLAWAKERFKADTYAMETTGIVIDAVGENYAKCSLTIQPKHLNAVGSVMGGAIFTLADFTFAVASNTQDTITVSLSSQINYLSVAKGETLFAEARCIKSGQSTSLYVVNITDELGTAVAMVSMNGFRKE